MIITKKFYKEDGMWYIDLPEFLEAGLGTKANLLMVAGADTFLDFLSNNTNKVSLVFSTTDFPYSLCKLNKLHLGMDKEYLDKIGHAPVDYGAYYDVVEMNKEPFQHKLWLCPVTEYVFGGNYPDEIYVKVL
jgi:hypothetical protein